MGRRAVVVGVDQEAELRLDLLVGEAEGAEHMLLKFGIGDPHRAGSQLDAVEDEVIAFRLDPAGVGVEVGEAFVEGHREGVVHRDPGPGLLVLFKERELDDPDKRPAFGDDIQPLGAGGPQGTKDRQGDAVLIGDDQRDVPLLAAEAGEDGGELLFREELRKRAAGLLVHPADKGEAFGADALRLFGQLVDLLAGVGGGAALEGDAADRTAVCDGPREDAEGGIFDQVGDILDLHPVADIRLIGAVPLHRLLVGEAGQRGRDFDPHRLLHQEVDKPFAHREDVLHVDKGHLQVDLGEFRLAVGPQVLVPEAAGELDVFVKARDHQKLLVHLGGLGQGVKAALMHPGGDDIVSRPFGGGLDHHRGVDLDKAFVREKLVGDSGNLRPFDQVLLEFPAAEVEVAVAEPQFLVGVGLVGDVERRGLGLGQDPQFGDVDFDIAGGELGVGSLPHPDGPAGHQHILASRLFGLRHDRTVGRVVKDQLDDAGAVPKVDKDQLPFIAGAVGETADHHLVASVGGGNLAAVMGPLHTRH